MAHTGTAGRLPAPPGAEAAVDSHAGLKVAALLLGILVGVLAIVSVFMWADARDARETGATASAAPAHEATAGEPATAAGAGAVATPSFAGIAPANAAALAEAHEAFPARLPAATPGPVVEVELGITHKVLEVAPGIRYQTWTFSDGVPGPVVHATEGQTVKVTLRNDSPMPHSVDFHAARVAPDKAFVDIAPGEKFTFSFQVNDPGVYMYHCGTKPVLAHIANGMYGAIVVSPKGERALPAADNEYVLVASEWYLNAPGDTAPAGLDMVKARQMTPDWVTWNGYAGQYVQSPLTAKPGETTRFYVVDAGPSLTTAFHVVGTVLQRSWVNGDVESPPQLGVQTVDVPAGGGAIFDVEIDEPGLYPFVSHSFASVDMGEVGLLRVGDVSGSMSH